ncbi:MAG: periplasmic copper chaperone A [Thiomicrorhabdus sp.]|nr:MAG: periplasmic copper chaperone A [Thiomicrorhabdus sp.]
MKKAISALTLGLLTSLSSFQVMANQASNVTVSDPYAREVPPGAHASASFMTLNNRSDHAIKLVQADSTVAAAVELHTHTNDNGMMRMRQVQFFTIPANGQSQLKPGGNHIMLIKPHKPLKAGQTVSLQLQFEDGSTKQVDMPVKSVMQNMGKMNHDMQHHH